MSRAISAGLSAATWLLLAALAWAEPPASTKLDPFGDPMSENAEDALESSLADESAEERRLVQQLFAAADEPGPALAALKLLPSPATELELRALRNLDRELAGSADPQHRELVAKAVPILAASGDATSLRYLHKVFDSQPVRRRMIADAIARFALAKQRRPHDWPLLVRSLTAVEGEAAVHVLQALRKFRERGTSPAVQRNVLLLALQLGDDRALEALRLLEYWTRAGLFNEATAAQTPVAAQLARWQQWYHEKYPSLPAAELPVDAPQAVYTFDELLAFVKSPAGQQGDVERGGAVFEKALCIKCHQFGERGERIGPDLSKVTRRLSDEELVQSLLFPNHQISDQYVTQHIELTDGRVLAGIVGEQGDSLVVLPADAVKRVIAKSEIATVRESPLSAMPAGLAEKLSRAEIADLWAYLRKVPE